MSNSKTAFPLGVYVGNIYDADFQSQFNAFVADMGGARPLFMDTYVDQSQDPSQWAANAQWGAGTWVGTGSQYVGPGSGVTPVVGVPLASNAAGWGNVDTFYQQIIAGTYDADYKGVIDAWAKYYPTVQFRLGYEFNGNFMPWSPADSSSPTANADFVAAFQHVANLVHTEGKADGITAQVVWNPGDLNFNGNVVPANLYPGNSYVDIISSDVYSPAWPIGYVDWSTGGTTQISGTAYGANPADLDHYWEYPNGSQYNPTPGLSTPGWSFADLLALAQQTGKPISISETGAGSTGATVDPADDPYFPQWLAGALAQAQAAGVTVNNVNIWDYTAPDGDWNFTNGSKPQEAAAWGQYFGAGSASTASSVPPTTIGAGPDSLLLQMSEDAWRGDAQFTVAVDGQQVGGVQTTTALHNIGQTQAFDIQGAFGAGTHTATVTFLNDAWGGSAATDRNLYVTGGAIDGAAITGASLTEMTNGTQGFLFQGSGSAVPSAPTVTVGSGRDTLALQMSEDAWQGDAQFTVAVDGQQVGGTQTTTALHDTGQSQTFDVRGTFGTGNHVATVTFTNDAWGGTLATDRNVYVNSAAIDGSTVNGASLTEMSNGAQSFTFQGSSAAVVSAASGSPAPVTVGSGPDTLTLQVSEDAWQGDAQFTVAVDGQQIGGTQTTTALNSAGQTQTFNVEGAFGAGSHTATVAFTNDAYGGSPSTDRNLYVNSATIDGSTINGAALTEMSNGPQSFIFQGSQLPAVTVGSGPSEIAMMVSEDAWQGDAQFTVAVDGQQIGGTLTASALHGNGQSQAFDIMGAFGAGSHQVAVSFVNDAYGGSPTTDRNLYVDQVQGSSVGAVFYSNGTQTFSAVVPSSSAVVPSS